MSATFFPLPVESAMRQNRWLLKVLSCPEHGNTQKVHTWQFHACPNMCAWRDQTPPVQCQNSSIPGDNRCEVSGGNLIKGLKELKKKLLE